MTSVKVQGLLVLAAVLLISMAPTETAVVESIADCAEFFLNQTSPYIPEILQNGRIQNQNRYKPICQTYKKSRTFLFATLYDIVNKIPVFSASKYKGFTLGRPVSAPWHIEPELENNVNMRPVHKRCIYENQAGRVDYTGSGFDKGHMLPSSYGFTEQEKESTFSLTNIVPQEHTFNTGSWNRMEICVKCVLDEYCINNNNKKEAFVVIGAKPSNGRLLNNRINIPSMLWSAFCCYSRSQRRWLASAHWGENIRDESKDKYLQTKTLAELYSELGGQFNVFPGANCPLTTTVSEFYPQLQTNCTCPPSNQSTAAPPTTASTPVTMTSNPSTILTSTSGDPRTTSGLLTSSTSQPTTTFPATKMCQTTASLRATTQTNDKSLTQSSTISPTYSQTYYQHTSGLYTTPSTVPSASSEPYSATSAPSSRTSALYRSSSPYGTAYEPYSTLSELSSTTPAPYRTTSELYNTTSELSSTSVPHSTTSGPYSTISEPYNTSRSHSTVSEPDSTTSEPRSTIKSVSTNPYKTSTVPENTITNHLVTATQPSTTPLTPTRNPAPAVNKMAAVTALTPTTEEITSTEPFTAAIVSAESQTNLPTLSGTSYTVASDSTVSELTSRPDSVSFSKVTSPSISTAYRIISSDRLPPASATSTEVSPPPPSSNSSILCAPPTVFFHYYQSIITYYQVIQQYRSNSYQELSSQIMYGNKP